MMSKPDRTLAVEYRPLGGLIPYARNARTHSDEQVARDRGVDPRVRLDQSDPGRWRERHHRRAWAVLAARKLGMATVPVIELAGMSEAEKRAYIIADNKLALNAGWDKDLLGLELADLDALGFDLSLTGFSGDELAGLLNVGNRRPHRSGRHPRRAGRACQPAGRPLASRQTSPALRRQHASARTLPVSSPA